MVKKVCVVTGSRAEYGLLRWVIEGIRDSASLELQLVVTGTHLSHEFGFTVQEIERDGFAIDYRVEMLLSSDTSVGVAKSLGLGVIGFADALETLKPDVELVLGERYEIFAAATPAMIARIPIAHIHGGELTEGAVDDAIRHAITKMSHLHFVAAEDYRDRVIQMGEQPDRVFNVGGLGVEAVKRTKLMSRSEVEDSLGVKFISPSFLITFHPVTLEPNTSATHFEDVLEDLRDLNDAQFLFTMPNADTEGRRIRSLIESFCADVANAHYFESLGQRLYLSTMAQVSGVVGNSSSGLLEAPAVGVGTVNIGTRQDRRIKASSVVDCGTQREDVVKALRRLTSESFRKGLVDLINPYGRGDASTKIISVLEEQTASVLLRKVFGDSPLDIAN